MLSIISIDPGLMTGFCYAELDIKKHKLRFYPFQMVDDVDDLYLRLKHFRPDIIIIEDFEYRGAKGRGLDLTPVQLIGVARLYSIQTGRPIYLQKAAQGKAYYTNPILKQLELYKRGEPHAMDATRHLLQWCMFGPGNRFIGKLSTEDFAEMLDSWEKRG